MTFLQELKDQGCSLCGWPGLTNNRQVVAYN